MNVKWQSVLMMSGNRLNGFPDIILRKLLEHSSSRLQNLICSRILHCFVGIFHSSIATWSTYIYSLWIMAVCLVCYWQERDTFPWDGSYGRRRQTLELRRCQCVFPLIVRIITFVFFFLFSSVLRLDCQFDNLSPRSLITSLSPMTWCLSWRDLISWWWCCHRHERCVIDKQVLENKQKASYATFGNT
jgi:hypothetical protein